MHSQVFSGLLCVCLITACNNTILTDDASYLTAGKSVKLMKPIEIRPGYSHVLFQDGKIITLETDLNTYRTSCFIDVFDLGPARYEADTFTVDRVTYKEEMYSDTGAVVRYYVEYVLDSETRQSTKPVVLTCQILDDIAGYNPFPISELRQAVGSYFEM